MATTSPDNIYSADTNTPQNLPAITGAMATSVQEALNKRGNAYAGTSSQRQSMTSSANDGTLWKDTDGGKELWAKDGGGWVKIWPPAEYSMTSMTAHVTAGQSIPVDSYVPMGNMTVANNTNRGPFTFYSSGGALLGTHIKANSQGLFLIEGWFRLVEMNLQGVYMRVTKNQSIVKNIMVQGLQAFAKSKPTFDIQHSTTLNVGDTLGVQVLFTPASGGPSSASVRDDYWSGFSATYFGSSA